MANNTDELRVLLWGRTGAGKSASGNTILGEKKFLTKLSAESKTKKCRRETGERRGKKLVVVDTPGLMHTSKSERDVIEALLSGIQMVSPGPHVFLYVIKPSAFSKADEKILKAFNNVFEDALRHHTIFLFTHEDEGHDIEQFIKNNLSFIRDDKIPYVVFNNQDDAQADRLLDKMIELVEKNKRQHYSNEGFKKAEDAFKERSLTASAADPSKDQLLAWIERGLDELEKVAPGLSYVRAFLDCVQEIAKKLIE